MFNDSLPNEFYMQLLVDMLSVWYALFALLVCIFANVDSSDLSSNLLVNMRNYYGSCAHLARNRA